jgi:uncharacterized membrane protein YidH (DUF202 family)
MNENFSSPSDILAFGGFPKFPVLPGRGRTAARRSRALAVMQWLMIGLIISLGVLLIAVAGAARHILQERAMHRRQAAPLEHSEETD